MPQLLPMTQNSPTDQEPDLLYSLQDLFRIRRELDRHLGALHSSTCGEGAGAASSHVDNTTVTRGDGAKDGSLKTAS